MFVCPLFRRSSLRWTFWFSWQLLCVMISITLDSTTRKTKYKLTIKVTSFILLPPISSYPLPLSSLYFSHSLCLCSTVSSRYQINARTELAVRYNDISPLENHHCAVAFQVFSQPDCNIFSNFDPETFKHIRQVDLCVSVFVWLSL